MKFEATLHLRVDQVAMAPDEAPKQIQTLKKLAQLKRLEPI